MSLQLLKPPVLATLEFLVKIKIESNSDKTVLIKLAFHLSNYTSIIL